MSITDPDGWSEVSPSREIAGTTALERLVNVMSGPDVTEEDLQNAAQSLKRMLGDLARKNGSMVGLKVCNYWWADGDSCELPEGHAGEHAVFGPKCDATDGVVQCQEVWFHTGKHRATISW